MHTYESYLRIMECDITSSDFTHKMHPHNSNTHTHTLKVIRFSGADQFPGSYLTVKMSHKARAEQHSSPYNTTKNINKMDSQALLTNTAFK